MYQISEDPAWDSKVEPKVLSTKCTSLRVFEEGERLKIASNYPTGNNISLYISVSAISALFKKLPNKFRTSSIEGLVATKRKLLVAFLVADRRYSCCILRKGGYTYILKPCHPLHNRCGSSGSCGDRS